MRGYVMPPHERISTVQIQMQGGTLSQIHEHPGRTIARVSQPPAADYGPEPMLRRLDQIRYAGCSSGHCDSPVHFTVIVKGTAKQRKRQMHPPEQVK
jgi:hypothetical protein